jgi:hypothetical protein
MSLNIAHVALYSVVHSLVSLKMTFCLSFHNILSSGGGEGGRNPYRLGVLVNKNKLTVSYSKFCTIIDARQMLISRQM